MKILSKIIGTTTLLLLSSPLSHAEGFDPAIFCTGAKDNTITFQTERGGVYRGQINCKTDEGTVAVVYAASEKLLDIQLSPPNTVTGPEALRKMRKYLEARCLAQPKAFYEYMDGEGGQTRCVTGKTGYEVQLSLGYSTEKTPILKINIETKEYPVSPIADLVRKVMVVDSVSDIEENGELVRQIVLKPSINQSGEHDDAAR